MDPFDRIERPHAAWWIAILAGMAATGALAISATCYGWFAENVAGWLPRWAIGAIFAWACWLHVKKGLRAVQLAERAGMRESALAWGWQTFLLGFASLGLLERLIAAKQAQPPHA
ncbi:MAG: DUF4499 domain-containing protein [Deltaproteobacteria bacterium]|nr:DUF4499 domain-containing protein [Deltaproteobacteria bacterium]